MNGNERALFQKMSGRIAKYNERGFTCKYRKTDYLVPWIPNRFHYGEWSLSNTTD